MSHTDVAYPSCAISKCCLIFMDKSTYNFSHVPICSHMKESPFYDEYICTCAFAYYNCFVASSLIFLPLLLFF